MFKLDFKKAGEPEVKLPTSIGSLKDQESFKNMYFYFTDYVKAFDCVDHKKLRKFFKRWEYQTILPASWEICMQVKKQQLESDLEKWTGSKLGKEHDKFVYCHPTYITYMQSTSCEMLGWMKHKLESRLLGEISMTTDMQITPPNGRKQRRTKEPLDEGGE